MLKKTIVSILTCVVLSVGLTMSGFSADAKTKQRTKTTRTTKTTSATPAKVATELPDGFGAATLLTYKKDWECYVFCEDNATRLVKMGFKFAGRGKSRVSMGSEDDSPVVTVKNGTFVYDGIKVTLRGDGMVE